jgi:hypothetical protein
MQFLFVPPLLFGNRRCRLPSQAHKSNVIYAAARCCLLLPAAAAERAYVT